MKSLNLTTIKYAGLLLFGMLLLFGCLKEGTEVNGLDDIQLVVVPSAQEVEVGDTVNFDILLLGEIVEADLYIDGSKISGHQHAFQERGIYTVFAEREGVKNSDSVEVVVGGDFEKLELSIVGYMESPSGTRMYVFKTEVGGDTISADIYVDDEKISGKKYSFDPRPEPYFVYAKKTGFLTSDTLEINIAPNSGPQLFLNASATEVTVGTEVSFTAGYVKVEPIGVNADFYIDGVKISGNKYKFEEEGNYTVVAKKEPYEDSEPITITVGKGQVSVYIAGYTISSSGKRFGHYWNYYKGGSLSYGLAKSLMSDANMANDIAVYNGEIYIAGAVADYQREHYFAQYWKRDKSNKLSTTTLLEGFAEATAVTIYKENIYMAGYNEGHPVYWKNGSMIDLAESGSKDEYTTSDITTYEGDVYISGGTRDVESPFDGKAFYWKNNASNRVPLLGNGTGALANGLAVYNGIVYVSGINITKSGRQAVYWINGDMVKLHMGAGDFSAAYDIKVVNGEVYACGLVSENGNYYAVYWKDNHMVKLTSGMEIAEGLSIDVTPDGNVYVAGWETHDGGYGSVAKYWKVDGTGKIEEVQLLKPTAESKANSIYLEMN